MPHDKPPQKPKKASGKKWKWEVKGVAKSPPLSLFTQQASDVIRMQAGYLDLESLINLSNTCKRARDVLTEPVATEALQKLLLCVLRGEQVQAELIIKSRPELSLKKGTVVDDFGRTFKNVSAITLAYGAHDVPMLAMMLLSLDVPGRNKAVDQITEQFPEQKEAKAKSYDFGPIIAAILADKDLEATIEKFRKEAIPSVIENGKHFDMDLILAAFNTLRFNWDEWSAGQRSLFYQGTIGYLIALLPVTYKNLFGRDVDGYRKQEDVRRTKDAVDLRRDLALEGRREGDIILLMAPILRKAYEKQTSMLALLRRSEPKPEHQIKSPGK